MRKISSILSFVFLLAITCGVFATWFQAPQSEDAGIYFAAARQADFQGNFPFNVHLSWELKPLGHRIFIYGVYKAATRISDFQDKEAFERAVKMVYGVFILLMTSGFVFGLRHILRDNGWSPPIVFLIILVIFFSMSYLITLQPEEISLLFIMAALPLALAKSRVLIVLAGLPLAALFTLKGITILLALQVLLMLYALGKERRKNLYWCAIGSAGWLVVIIVLLLVVFPQEIRDMRDATLIQGSLEFELRRFITLPWAFWHKVQFSPIVAPAALFSWVAVPILVWQKRWDKLAWLFLVWAIGSFIVIVQGLFFAYHYSAFVVTAAMLFLAIFSRSHDLDPHMTNRKLAYLAAWSFSLVGLLSVLVYFDRGTVSVVPLQVIGFNMAALLVGLIVLFGWLFLRHNLKTPFPTHRAVLAVVIIVFAGTLWVRYQSPWTLSPDRNNVVEDHRRIFRMVEERHHLSEQKELLYLATSGVHAYYFGAPTHCRQFTVQPLARFDAILGAKSLQESPIFLETLDCVLSYEGKYIAGTLPREHLSSLAEKIDREYERIILPGFSGAIPIYKRVPAYRIAPASNN